MTFGEDWGAMGASHEESRAVFDAYGEAGGNFLDTANGYTGGTSEKFIGEFVADERDKWVIATKFTANTRAGDLNAGGNGRKTLRQNLDASLKRLQTDYVDLLWVHAWDFSTPVDEVMRGLDDVVRAGKVLYIGASNVPAWIVAQANTLADARGWTPFSALQIEYSLIERTPEREFLPMARALDLAITPWSPLGSGILTGKYNQVAAGVGANGGGDTRRLDAGVFADFVKPTERKLAIAAETVKVAGEIGVSPAQVALAWLMAQKGTVIPIIGSRKVHQLKDNLGAADLTLAPEHQARLDAVSHEPLGYPHDFLSSGPMTDFVYGGQFGNLDNTHEIR